jgi:hypothetical protein
MAILIPCANTDRSDRVADVVFVHGLDGDARSTWTTPKLKDGFWPEWLGADLPDVGIWSIEYAVKSSSWAGYSMALVERARSLLDLLVGNGIGDRAIIFIAHSFGGLVVKQLLRAATDSASASWNEIAAQTCGIAFLATPQFGSRLANWVRRIPFYFGTVTVSELEEHSPQLKDLGSWFRNFQPGSKIKVIVYTEARRFKGIRVVRDGDPYLPGVEAVPLDDDHVSITRPISKQSQLYRGILHFMRERRAYAATHDNTLEALASSLQVVDKVYPQVKAVIKNQRVPSDRPYSQVGSLQGDTIVVISTEDGKERMRISRDELNKIAPADRTLIRKREKSMTELYKQWLDLFSQRNLGDPAQQQQTEQSLEELAKKMCGDLNFILHHLGSIRVDLKDHYGAMHSVCWELDQRAGPSAPRSNQAGNGHN